MRRCHFEVARLLNGWYDLRMMDEKEGKMSKLAEIIAVAFCVLFTALVAPAGASVPAGVPEIDPSVASSAIALLTCGLLMLTAKRKRKKEDRR
jgi:hypothetical protein